MFKQTPSQTVGPFFHPALVHSGENVLVDEQTSGQLMFIVGKVYDGEGKPVNDALLEIWQADSRGFFNHPIDPHCMQADRHFRGFGRTGTVNEGRFEFKTVKPGRLPGPDGQLQAPHIDIRVFSRGMLIHAYTRLYFSDERANETDAVLNSVEPERRATLIAMRIESNDLPTYHLDIHLQGENETVFFEP
ncbi:MAG: protocatechuate 3,4-dioxygenase subunit alpha [Omnitrophica WOR_2 bacterium]